MCFGGVASPMSFAANRGSQKICGIQLKAVSSIFDLSLGPLSGVKLVFTGVNLATNGIPEPSLKQFEPSKELTAFKTGDRCDSYQRDERAPVRWFPHQSDIGPTQSRSFGSHQRLHHSGGALDDGPHQNAAHQADGPAEAWQERYKRGSWHRYKEQEATSNKDRNIPARRIRECHVLDNPSLAAKSIPAGEPSKAWQSKSGKHNTRKTQCRTVERSKVCTNS